jgi:hypothetical protein
MRITNQNQTPVPPSDNSADAVSTPRHEAAAPSSPAPSVSYPSFPISLVPSFELFSLTSTLSEVPPVRQQVVAETVRRLAAGQLQTTSALDQTARAILGIRI